MYNYNFYSHRYSLSGVLYSIANTTVVNNIPYSRKCLLDKIVVVENFAGLNFCGFLPQQNLILANIS